MRLRFRKIFSLKTILIFLSGLDDLNIEIPFCNLLSDNYPVRLMITRIILSIMSWFDSDSFLTYQTSFFILFVYFMSLSLETYRLLEM